MEAISPLVAAHARWTAARTPCTRPVSPTFPRACPCNAPHRRAGARPLARVAPAAAAPARAAVPRRSLVYDTKWRSYRTTQRRQEHVMLDRPEALTPHPVATYSFSDNV